MKTKMLEKHIYCPQGHKGTSANSITEQEYEADYYFNCEKCDKQYMLSDYEIK